MTPMILEQLETRFLSLIAALDDRDPDRITDVAAAIRPLIIETEKTKSNVQSDVMRLRLRRLSGLVNEARISVNRLTLENCQSVNSLTYSDDRSALRAFENLQ